MIEKNLKKIIIYKIWWIYVYIYSMKYVWKRKNVGVADKYKHWIKIK